MKSGQAIHVVQGQDINDEPYIHAVILGPAQPPVGVLYTLWREQEIQRLGEDNYADSNKAESFTRWLAGKPDYTTVDWQRLYIKG